MLLDNESVLLPFFSNQIRCIKKCLLWILISKLTAICVINFSTFSEASEKFEKLMTQRIEYIHAVCIYLASPSTINRIYLLHSSLTVHINTLYETNRLTATS